MTEALRFSPAAAIFDIEGTIGPIPYVLEVMYPYLDERIASYLEAHRGEAVIEEILADTARIAGPDADPVEALRGWLAKDLKIPPLKKLQGLVWEAGYTEGAFEGQIFEDALAALKRWNAAGIPLYIFSSASVQTQVQFYQYSRVGDLRPLFAGHFDTDVGAKVETQSYRKIAAAIGVPPEGLLFFSDNPRELAAAREAGVEVVHVVRDGTPSDPRFREIGSFDEVELVKAPAVA